MALPNIFSTTITEQFIKRINNLNATSPALWGKMNVVQMLAHCNVTYELIYDNIHAKPNAIIKFILKLFVKKPVVSETPYKKNGNTGPQFVISTTKNFEVEKTRLIEYLKKTQQLGEEGFDGKESHSFGILTKTEWNNMFYKHLDHHLSQFGV